MTLVCLNFMISLFFCLNNGLYICCDIQFNADVPFSCGIGVLI